MNVLSFVLVLIVLILSVNAQITCEEKFQRYVGHNHFIRSSSPSTIYVLQYNYDKEQHDLTIEFIKLIKDLGFKIEVINVSEFCVDGYEATQIVADYFGNVINLKVPIPKDFTETGNLMIAGYVGEYANIRQVCLSGKSSEIKVQDGTEYNETCLKFTAFEKGDHVKLISKSIRNYALLYKIINDFSLSYRKQDFTYWKKYVGNRYATPLEELSVIVCSDIINDYFLAIPNVRKCRKIEDYILHNPLAALVPEPIAEESKTDLPVIFYNIPFMLPEHEERYRNGMVLYDNYFSLLARGLVKSLESIGWRRVALISDDSPYSEAFEKELVQLLQKKEIPYRLKQCVTNKCHFEKSLKSLKQYKAAVIIVNVEFKYAKTLVEAAANEDLKSTSGIIWIWRDWPFVYDFKAEKLGTVFSIHVSPLTSSKTKSQRARLLDNINDGISQIKSVSEHTQVWKKFSEITFEERSRFFSEHLRQNLQKRTSVRVNLIKIDSKNFTRAEVVHSVLVKTFSDDVSVTFSTEINYVDPLVQPCMITTSNYDNPCDDPTLLYIVGIIFFLLLSLFATYIIYLKCIIQMPPYVNLS